MKQKIILIVSLSFLAFNLAYAQGNWQVNGSSMSPNTAIISSNGNVTASGTYKWVSNFSFINDNHLASFSFALPASLNSATATPSLTDANNAPIQGATFVSNDGGWTCSLPAGTVFAPNTELVFKISNLEIKDDIAYTNQQLTHFISFRASPQNEVYTDNVSTITFATTANTPLPVNLLNFDARLIAVKGKEQVALNWATSSEVNADYFNVQRSKNSQEWENILKVKSQGNSNTEVSYQDFDKNPLLGLTYYRLEQVDNDKNSTFSVIRTVNRKSTGGTLSIFPNPTSDKISIECYFEEDAQVEIQVLTIDGRIVQRKTNDGTKGLNTFVLDISKLASGSYDVSIIKNSEVINTGKVQKN